MNAPAAEIDRLYTTPLEEFTATRDALARDLRGRGERDAADTVKRLRKPSAAAWAINQLVHRHRKRVNELLAAGGRLRDAQAALLEGGDRGLLRDAAAGERTLVAELVALAISELEQAGLSAGPAVQTKVHETLHAAAGNEEVRDRMAAGRLHGDYQLGDLGLGAGGAAPARSAKRTPPRSTKRASAREHDQSRALASVRRRLEQARSRQSQLRGQVREAEMAAREAQRALRAASAAAERADAGVEQLRERSAGTAARVLELEEELAGLEG